MKNSAQPGPAASGGTFSPPELFVTIAVGIVALGLVIAEFAPATNGNVKMNLPALNQRAAMLRRVDDPVRRDAMCIPLSAYSRALDRAIDPNARVFLSGMIGKENGGRRGYYFFLRNYLFPRELEISLGHPSVFHNEWTDGTDCDSPDVLRTNGFDLFLRFGNDGNISLIPLTQKGVPKQ